MYSAEISRANPTSFVFLVDQSASMQDPIGSGEGERKCDVVANALNRLLSELAIKCAKEEGIRDYFYVSVFGYGSSGAGPALSGPLAGRDLVPLSEIAASPARLATRNKKVPDGAGGLVEQEVKFPIWVDPVANGGTPMSSALTKAESVVSRWLNEHPACYPPVVLNLTDGEANDVASLDLSGVQEDLVQAVFETGTPTVVVLINGRPLSTRWTSEHVPALVEAWQPGERGGEAVADVLFGNYNPTGRLAISVPRHSGALPAYYNYKPSKAYWMATSGKSYVDIPATPLYPFGYGLSYTTFDYSNLHVEPQVIHPGGEARVTLDVKNTGERAGVETVQLYVHEEYAPVSTPVKQLRGFARVALEPGEKKTVTLALTPEDLQLLDVDMRWRVVPGDFEVMVGKSSADILLHGVLKVTP